MSRIYLNDLHKGDHSIVIGFNLERAYDQAQAQNLEDRLLEMGFEEGLPVEVLHEGPVSRDPMAVRLGRVIVALRRNEAAIIEVTKAQQAASEQEKA